jgi:vitamin B12/bleomycin/antimicrobial peptide transport system ATP-binding/permease protein
MPGLRLLFLKEVWKLTRAYWYSEEKRIGRLLLAVIIGLSLGRVYLLVLLNQWNNEFYNTLQNHDKDGFFSAFGDFTILATCFIIVAVYEFYLQQMLEIKWRRWITEHYLKTWFKKRTYYLMELKNDSTDNPDQRISEDLKLFVSSTLQLSLGLLKATVTLISFVFILWNLSGEILLPFGEKNITIHGYMVWMAIIYAVIGTWLTQKIGHPLVGLNFMQQRYEADFRFSLVRLRENSEGIAFYHGEAQEQTNLLLRFKGVFENFRALMKRQKMLTWFTSGYGQAAIIFPFLVAAPRYFSNQIQLGGLMQTASAFGRVQDALSFFVDSYSALAEWKAVVNRLTGFSDHMKHITEVEKTATVKVNFMPDSTLTVQNLCVDLPTAKRLVTDLELQIHAGDTVLITGDSGCGKSTLMRTLAGIWPFGTGYIVIPEGKSRLFLPQKSYLPLGTLRDALLYPYGAAMITDEAIQEVMVQCKLDSFSDKLHQTENWSHILSLGEQQRIAFARAILQRPDWLFLDEATSALDEATEQVLYQLLLAVLKDSTIISVGHRSTLAQYHKRKLHLEPTGNWQME